MTIKKQPDHNTSETGFPFNIKLGSAEKKQLKKDLMALFRSYGYMQEDMDYEVRFKTTSGNIAWININSIEIIK